MSTKHPGQQFLDTYFGGRADLFKAITAIARTCLTIQNDKRALRDLIVNEWLKYLEGVFEKTEQFPTRIERLWWSVNFEKVGLSFNDIVMNPYLQYLVENHWDQLIKDGFEQSKIEGAIPSNVKTLEEYLALRFAPPKTRLYTNDPIYQVLGVKSEQDLEGLSNAEFYLKLAKMVTDGSFAKLHNAAFHDRQRAFNNFDAVGDRRIDEIKLQRLRAAARNPKKKRKYSIDARLEDSGIVHKGSEYQDEDNPDIKAELQVADDSTEAKIEYISDSDRLSQFCELAGIGMSTLTDGEANRVIDLLYALDPDIGGYDLASKQGVSVAAYYGDRADSEKTQRQRLFKKIKEASDKAK